MKKTLIIIQIVCVALVCLKVVATGQLFGKTITAPPTPGASADAVRDTAADDLAKERDLYSLLEKKMGEVNAKEAALREEEGRLAAIKKEIQDRIDALTELEKRLDAKLAAEKAEDLKRYKDLAKIYENAAPAKAGAMMEKLDTKTAAGIAMNMKKDKAGTVLSHVPVAKAVEITREIVRVSPAAPAKE
ncbi:MAG TPA: hypothetical protein PK836_02510 [Syntrophales bacterium]|nr:hypothetical protein [Syntrophales bacterium]HOM07609.1 hypothetical protein [Syntrophales bacterium]HON99429.1 hypothetical protein [Syntrophales bacterium]HPC00535.1 hypothetical protein [Syntrophales bacterium]HPQ06706.1 hypothetical protein [Syntrophales bacterium]